MIYMASNTDLDQFSNIFDNCKHQAELNLWIEPLRQDIQHEINEKKKEENEKFSSL